MKKSISCMASLLTLALALIFPSGCATKNAEMTSFMQAVDEYETAWAEGDFKKVDSFFAPDAKRLHTEPYVWDRAMITEWCRDKAAEVEAGTEPREIKDWKSERDYLGIRVEGDIAYDVFTTERFKALHIWEKQADGSWKILFDMGMLNNPEQE